ncbi:MAG: MBL fold metallo-hydrolase, partial [Candidatus Diapherotrites archaeon]|nr:MBL fold metallo-hydrolase [Candidatus Diapherotrites archaeon]
YCNREHEPRKDVENHFIDKISETLDTGGAAMVPAFAVGRAQEIVQVVADNDFGVPIYLDGMAKDASDIIVSYPEFIRDYDALQSALQECIWIENERERRRIKKEPYIVVTTAGMLSGGPIYHYMWANRKNENSKILLTGYQVPGTPGEKLMREGTISIRNTELKMNQEVIKFDFSSHAGKQDIFDFVKDINPEKIMCVHGDGENIIEFEKELKEAGFDAVAPKLGDTLNL